MILMARLGNASARSDLGAAATTPHFVVSTAARATVTPTDQTLMVPPACIGGLRRRGGVRHGAPPWHLQQLKTFRIQRLGEKVSAGDVSARPVEAHNHRHPRDHGRSAPRQIRSSYRSAGGSMVRPSTRHQDRSIVHHPVGFRLRRVRINQKMLDNIRPRSRQPMTPCHQGGTYGEEIGPVRLTLALAWFVAAAGGAARSGYPTMW